MRTRINQLHPPSLASRALFTVLLATTPLLAQAQDAFGGGPKGSREVELRITRLEQEVQKIRSNKAGVPGMPGAVGERGGPPGSGEAGGSAAPAQPEREYTPEELGYKVKGTLNGVRIIERNGVTAFMTPGEFDKYLKEAKAALNRERLGQGPNLNLPAPPGVAVPRGPLPPGTAMAAQPNRPAAANQNANPNNAQAGSTGRAPARSGPNGQPAGAPPSQMNTAEARKAARTN